MHTSKTLYPPMQGRSRRKSLEILAHQGSAAMRALQQHQPQAIVIACTDCELPIPESFGAAASHVVVLRYSFQLLSLMSPPQ